MSATVLIGLDIHRPLLLDIREQSNSSQDFCTFLTLSVEMGFFVPGDVLVYDNAAVHFAMDTWEEVSSLLGSVGVTTIPLPTYSPELNPIEKCFGVVKHHLRYGRQLQTPLLLDILKGFSKITPTIVAAEYLSCLATSSYPFLIPPINEWFHSYSCPPLAAHTRPFLSVKSLRKFWGFIFCPFSTATPSFLVSRHPLW